MPSFKRCNLEFYLYFHTENTGNTEDIAFLSVPSVFPV